MVIWEHSTKEKIGIKKFQEIIKKYSIKDIETTAHTFFRINEGQRKVYTEDLLKKYLIEKRPIEVIKQPNGNISAMYKFKEGDRVIKIVLNVGIKKVYIVTFYILTKEQMEVIGK